MHLESAADHGMTTIALGTRAWEVLAEFKRIGGSGAEVLLYASLTDGPVEPFVSWVGRFVDVEEAVGNGAPSSKVRRYRPPSTTQEDRDAGWWYAYYTVTNLARLNRDDRIPIGELSSWGTGKLLSPFFIPEGPIIVDR